MNKKQTEDIALAALLKTAQKYNDSSLIDLLRKGYEIERRHQFDTEEQRDSSVQELQRLLELTIEAAGGDR